MEHSDMNNYDRIDIIEKLFLISIIFTSGTEITLTLSFPSYFMLAIFGLLILLHRIDFRHVGSPFLFIIIVGVVWTIQCTLYTAGNTDTYLSLAKSFLSFAMVIIYSNTKSECNKERFQFCIKALLTISIISNILFVLAILGVPLPRVSTLHSRTISIMFLENYSINPTFGFLGYRNYGIFWEPGMYQIYLNLILIYYLYSKELTFAKKCLISIYIVLTIITTASTTGYVLTIVIFGLFAIKNSSKIYVKVLLIILFAIGLMIIFPYLESAINTKLTLGTSFEKRFADLSDGWNLYKSKPLFGYGIENNIYDQYYESLYGYNRGNSNGLISILINFGFVGFTIYVACFSRFLSWINRNIQMEMTLPLIAWAVLSFNGEPVSTKNFMFLLLGIGLSYKQFKRIRLKQMVRL